MDMNQRFAPTHTPEFHEALERLGVIAQLFDEGISYDDLPAQARKAGLSRREANLERQFLVEACGCVVANELGLRLTDTISIEEAGKRTEVKPETLEAFLAAYFLAYNLRHGGRNDLFGKIVIHSSLNSVLHNFLNSDPVNKLSDLQGATYSTHIWVD